MAGPSIRPPGLAEPEDSIRRRTIEGLDEDAVDRLLAAGETLFVERRQDVPAAGLAPTIAAFANTLGGWLLLSVDDLGNPVGYDTKGRADLQEYVRDKLRSRIDPMPPFVAKSVKHRGADLGIVRVYESVDTPHIVSANGGIYVRVPGGKQSVKDHGTLVAMAQRGRDAARVAARRAVDLPHVATFIADVPANVRNNNFIGVEEGGLMTQ